MKSPNFSQKAAAKNSLMLEKLNSFIYHFFLCSFLVGTSDPYVKFKVAGKEVFRSKTIHKNLNPVWDERASLLVETLRDPLYVKVFMNPHNGHEDA